MAPGTEEEAEHSQVVFNNRESVKLQAQNQYFYGSVQISGDNSQNTRTDDGAILESLAFPQMLDRRSNVEAPHRNTCTWILELDKYKNWVAQPSGLLWIKGKPGAGKSTLMNFLYSRVKEHCDTENGICLEFFFSARGVEMQQTPLGMLRSLLNQLFRQDENIRPGVRETFTEKCNAFGSRQHSWEWQPPELKNLLWKAIVTSAEQRPVTVFVDALDEAGEQSAVEVARYFHELNDRITSAAITAKICISCRHYPIVAEKSAIEVCVEEHNGDDIANFIEDRLVLSHLVESDSDDQETWRNMKTDLIQQAKGVFQWVHLIVPIITKQIKDGKSPDYVRHWMRQVPSELSEVYKYILEHVIEQQDREQSFLFFQWLCLAERPLSVREMRFAMAAKHIVVSPPGIRCHETSYFIRKDDIMKRRINALSGGLAEAANQKDSEEMIVQVVHQSVKEFLLDQGLRLLQPLKGKGQTISPHLTVAPDKGEVILQSQATLYQSCLYYLATEEIHASDELEIQELEGHEIREIRAKLTYDSPLIAYATINLFVHAEEAGRHRSQDMQEEIQLLQQIIPKWIQLYQVFEDWRLKCPSFGSTLLHAASGAGLTDIVRHLLSHDVDVNEDDDKGNTALHYAARWGHTKVVELLLRMKATLDAQNRFQETPLLQAASHRQFSVVKFLLDNGSSFNKYTGESGSALQAACYDGDAKVVRILVDAGADINAQGGYYGNALQAASYGASETVVQILLDAGADINAQGGCYGNALQAASLRGREKVVQILLDAGADINAQGGQYGNALQAASLEGYEKVVQILLDAGADINAQGGQYGNALQVASWKGHEKVVQILLDAGADINAQGGQYGNALQAASLEGREKVVQILLDAGADINAQGGYYGNALQVASWKGYEKVVQILLDAGADINAQGGLNGNALQAASLEGREKVVQILLDAGADINAQGGCYGNALQAASLRGREKVVQILLDAGADINAQGGYYGNALQAASLEGHEKVVQILLDAGADINAQGGYYGNALQAASLRGREKVVQILLDAGADINAQGGYYGNALQAASLRGREKVVQILLDAGADINAQGGEALKEASSGGHEKVVQLLLEAGTNVNDHGKYALDAAISRHREKVVQILLDAGTNVNDQGGYYGTALLAAVRCQNDDLIQRLILCGADPSIPDHRHAGSTPLHFAAKHGDLGLVDQLQELGADVNAKDLFSRTPLHLAVYNAHNEVIAWLLKGGSDPLALDGYGRNALDWAGNDPSMLDQIQVYCSSILPTPGSIRIDTLHRSVCQLTERLLASKSKGCSPGFEELGHCLIYLQDFDNARICFEQCAYRYRVHCNVCLDEIKGSRFVCKNCPDVDLCSECLQQHCESCPEGAFQNHEFLEVSSNWSLPKVEQASSSVSYAVQRLLRDLRLRFGEKGGQDLETSQTWQNPGNIDVEEVVTCTKTRDGHVQAMTSTQNHELSKLNWHRGFVVITITVAVVAIVAVVRQRTIIGRSST